jgi:hypothetical protein
VYSISEVCVCVWIIEVGVRHGLERGIGWVGLVHWIEFSIA